MVTTCVIAKNTKGVFLEYADLYMQGLRNEDIDLFSHIISRGLLHTCKMVFGDMS